MCLSPVVIYNTEASQYLLADASYYNPVINRFVNCWPYVNHWLSTGKVYISPKKVGANKSNFSDFHVLTKEGEAIPLFITVPCGKCLLCKNKKTIDFTTRCLMEAATSISAPYFITLTYNPEHLPTDNKPDKRACQLFLKRLRKQLPSPFRYILVSEFGAKSRRLHYHAILFNVTLQPIEFLSILRKCWTFGFVYSERISARKNKTYTQSLVDSINYTSKYIFIGQTEETFMISSRGRGVVSGIGSEYANKIKPFHVKHPTLTTLRINLFGTVVERPIPSYIKDKFFPSASRLMPLPLRATLKEIDRLRECLYHSYKYLNPSVLSNPYSSAPSYLVSLFGRFFTFKWFSQHVKYEIDFDTQKAIDKKKCRLFYADTLKTYTNTLQSLVLLDLFDFFDNAEKILHSRAIHKKVIQDYAISHPNEQIDEEKYVLLQKKLQKSLQSRIL